jgi:hypothetical protein
MQFAYCVQQRSIGRVEHAIDAGHPFESRCHRSAPYLCIHNEASSPDRNETLKRDETCTFRIVKKMPPGMIEKCTEDELWTHEVGLNLNQIRWKYATKMLLQLIRIQNEHAPWALTILSHRRT